ncbi:MAG: hypothetical protein EBV05_09855, partial [Cyanobacteria bacterium WB6_1B_304]|nr:hypothetical protein [Cyanobacteria bacterium WB6_1B_304]
MSFDWFNRFEKDTDDTEHRGEGSASTPDDSSVNTEPMASAIAEDYLTFAKTAYENLKRQQALKQQELSSGELVPTPENAIDPLPTEAANHHPLIDLDSSPV